MGSEICIRDSRVPLGELGELVRGRRFTKSDYVDAGGIGSIHYAELYTHFGTSADSVPHRINSEMEPRMRFAHPGDVVIAEVGETVEEVGKAMAWLGDEKVAVHDGCFVLSHSLNPVFVSYCLQTTTYHAQKARYVSRAKLKRLRFDGIKKLAIPVPPRATQDRLVEILETLDALICDPSNGIPAEISARRNQYEFYRDRLLNFEELAT